MAQRDKNSVDLMVDMMVRSWDNKLVKWWVLIEAGNLDGKKVVLSVNGMDKRWVG